MKVKTITISVPAEMESEIQEVARDEQRTVSELMRETFRQYRAKRAYHNLAKKVRAAIKKKGLTPKDFGGPFED